MSSKKAGASIKLAVSSIQFPVSSFQFPASSIQLPRHQCQLRVRNQVFAKNLVSKVSLKWSDQAILRRMPTKPPDPGLYSDGVASIAGAGLDSSDTLPANSHPPALAVKSAPTQRNNHTKTVVVVPVVRIVPVAVGAATIMRIVVPRAAAPHPEVPAPSSGLAETREHRIETRFFPKNLVSSWFLSN